MKNIHKIYYKSPLGIIEIGSVGDHIVSILFDRPENNVHFPESEVEKTCLAELDAYFNGKLQQFTFPFLSTGTDFQRIVWNELQLIPYGATVSYGELSVRIGKPSAVRAVGTANGSNPLSIVIPCHRVIGSNGKLIGYGGGLWRKQWLLEHEKKHKYGIMKLF